MRQKKESLSLPCILTKEELLACSQIQNQAIEKKTNAEAEMKAFNTQKKGEIDGSNAMISVQYQKISTGKEYRMVQCRIIYDFDRKEKSWIREDTGEIVKTDIITESELQEEIELQQKEQDAAKEKAGVE